MNATIIDYIQFSYDTVSVFIEYFYTNDWGVGFSSSYFALCDDAIRAPFTKLEEGNYYANQGIISS